MKPFKKVLGKRVYLELPDMPDSAVILSDGAKKELLEAEKAKLLKLKVYAVGDQVTSVEEGDVIMADPRALMNAPTISVGDGVKVIIIEEYDVSHIWQE